MPETCIRALRSNCCLLFFIEKNSGTASFDGRVPGGFGLWVCLPRKKRILGGELAMGDSSTKSNSESQRAGLDRTRSYATGHRRTMANSGGHARLCNARKHYAIAALPPRYDRNDPNGIRTRVTAVKGRCPRPLDDRVNESGAISELLLPSARQIAFYTPALDTRAATTRAASQARESAPLPARLRRSACSKLLAHSKPVVVALCCRAEVRRARFRVH